MRIPVFAGPRIVAVCDRVSVLRYLGAANAEVVRKRKTGEIVQINLLSHGDDSLQPSAHRDARPTYQERLESTSMTMLKRLDPETGQLVCWSDRDQFSPRRFNPDAVPA
jgi:hypothetical protein